MREFKGTKGKWDSMPANQMGVPYIIFVDNETIFQCYGEKAKENMQVAKCAPEILEMIKELLLDIDEITIPTSMNNTVFRAEQLIKKATE